MRILVISQYYPPDIGGSHRRAYNAVRGLEKNGHSVEVVTAFPHYPLGTIPLQYKCKILAIEQEERHRIIRVWLPSVAHKGYTRRLFMYILFSFTALLALPLVKRPDVIWATSPSIFSSIPATLYSKIMRVPVVRNVDDLWPETAAQLGFLSKRKQRIGEWIAKIAYSTSSALTPISTAYIPTLSSKYGIESDKIFTAEVGVDIDAFQMATKENLPETLQFRVVYSGLLGVAYDFKTVLDTAKILRQDNHIHFLIRGVGEMEEYIRNTIDEMGLSNVTFSSKFLEQGKLIELLTNADALLLPMTRHASSDTGLPTKLLEYMACGRPVICISSGESARIVQEANCGIVVPFENSSKLAQEIRDLRNNSNREVLGHNGREYAKVNFSLLKIAKKLESAFYYAIKK